MARKYVITGPDGRKYQVTAPDDMSAEDVLARFRREMGGGESEASDAAYRREIDEEARKRQEGPFAVGYTAGRIPFADQLLPYASGATEAGIQAVRGLFGGEGSVGDAYARGRDVMRRQFELERENTGFLGALPGDILGGALMAPTGAAEAGGSLLGRIFFPQTPQGASFLRAMRDTIQVGAAYGALHGLLTPGQSLSERLETAGEEALGGALGAGALHAGGSAVWRATRPLREAFRRWRLARAETAREFTDAGVDLFAPAVGGTAVRSVAGMAGGTLTGSALRAGARRSIADLETQLADTLAQAGGRFTPGEAGEAAQGLLRRAVLDRSRPKEEIERLAEDELRDIAGGTRTAYGPQDVPPIEPVYRTVASEEITPPPEMVAEQRRLQAEADAATQEVGQLTTQYNQLLQRLRDEFYDQGRGGPDVPGIARRIGELEERIASLQAGAGRSGLAGRRSRRDLAETQRRLDEIVGRARLYMRAGSPINRDLGLAETRQLHALGRQIVGAQERATNAANEIARLSREFNASRPQLLRERQTRADEEARRLAEEQTQAMRDAAARGETAGQRESYPTTFDAAYELNRRTEPAVQENLLGRRGRRAQPPRVPRRRLEGRYTPDEIEGVVAAWQYAKTPQTAPERLASFIHRIGGINDEGGGLAAIIGGPKARPGLIRRAGLSADDVGRMAWEEGFFRERPSINELADAIKEDLSGRPVVREADQDALLAMREHLDMVNDLGRLGVLGARSADEVRAILGAERSPIGMPGMTFRTSRGSTYAIQRGGTTVRDKAARSDPGHEGQQGIQPESERTYYIDPAIAQRLALPQGEARIIDHGDGTLSVATRSAGGQWGIAPSQRAVPVSTEPRVGLAPVELWGGGATAGSQSYRRIHLGNEIVEISGTPLPVGGQPARRATSTHVTRLLADIAEEARGMFQLRGFRGSIFGTDHRLKPEILDYLRPRVGDQIADLLAAYSDARATGQFVPGIQGLQNIRTVLGRAIRAAEQAERATGQGTERRAMIERLYGAVDQDIQHFLARTPEGQAFRAERERIDALYSSFVHDIRAPLQRILGENVNPVTAITRLVQATQAGGDLTLLRAFYRVATNKGDRLVATGWLLHNMAEGGLQGFLRAYRSLSEDARRLMFQGSAEELGRRLDLLARVGGRLERFARMAAPNYAIDPTRLITPGNIGLGLAYWVSMPALITTALGTEIGSRVLASRWFGRWYSRMPVERGPDSPQWRDHVRRLLAILAQDTGLGESLRRGGLEALRGALASFVPGARAEEASLRGLPTAFGVAGKPGAGGSAVAGKAGTGGKPDVDPDVAGSVLAFQPRFPTLTGEENEPPRISGSGLWPREATWEESAREGLIRMGFPRTLAERLALPLRYTGVPPYDSAQLITAGIDQMRPELVALGAFTAPLPGTKTLATVIGAIGARNLAAAGRTAAKEALAMAERMAADGVSDRRIISRVNRMISREDPLLGGIVRLPRIGPGGGEWVLEISDRDAVFTSPPVPPSTVQGMPPIGAFTDLEHVYHSPELFRAYPGLREQSIRLNGTLAGRGHALPPGGLFPGSPALIEIRPPLWNNGLAELQSTTLHEIQHIVQMIEQLPQGGSSSAFRPGGRLAWLLRENETPHQAYTRLLGEWLARRAQARATMTGAQLRRSPLLRSGGTEDPLFPDERPPIIDYANGVWTW